MAKKPEPKKKKGLSSRAVAGISIGGVLILCLVVILLVVLSQSGCASKASSETVTAKITVENYGVITLELDPSAAPETVQNFVDLAESGFYDGLTFHRIMSGFMIQGGDPSGNGTGGSGRNIRGEFTANGVQNSISHVRGTISMARSPYSYDSASSQFFIVHQDSTFLDGQYAAFGHVTDGMDVVDAICRDARPTDNNGTIPPEAQPVITSVVIVEE